MVSLKDREKDIALTSAFIALESFDRIKERLGGGYLDVLDNISSYAIEFVDKHENTDWEKLLNSPETYGFSQNVCCWEEAVLEFVSEKLS